jgi:benzoylformate decarboxylase
MLGRHVFLESLLLHEATRIFGNPGTTETPLLDSLRDYPGVEYIVALQESVAVAAASHYSQASGHTSVVNMHVAPGLGNAIGMIYGALKAKSPMIVTAGAQDTRLRLRDPLLGYDLVAMAAPVVKWSVQVEHADEMASIMRRAFKIANEHPKGPVFVALPINVMEQQTELLANRAANIAIADQVPESALSQLASMIKQSKHFGVVIGDDVARSGATESLISLAQATGAGIHNELLPAQTSFPVRHDHYRGKLPADNGAIKAVLGRYDLVLLLGGAFFEEVWFSDESPFADDARVAQIELSSATLAHNFAVDLGLAGDLADALARLNEMDVVGDAHAANAASLSTLKTKEDAAQSERMQGLWDRSPMAPARALKLLADTLPEDVVVVDESITAGADVTRNFRLAGPGDGYGGRGGGIGQGISGAVGTAVAHPDRLVVALSGDGSAMYSIQSLWSAAHHDLNILFVILSNREYRILKHNVNVYRTRFEVPSNNPYPHMDLTNPEMDFSQMAIGMGVPAVQVSKPEEVEAAVQAALETSGPYLIDIIVEGLETP